MIEPEIPENEQQRLAMLRSINILDTPIEERFERITRMVKRVLHVPIVAISLIDESRQWFKSIQGSDLVETPRNISFCGHAILQPEILIVKDTKSDPRFFDNPLVVNSPFVRFYAGYPLCINNQIRVGTLCVFDTVVREMNAEDIQFIEDMANSITNELKAILLKIIYHLD